jgi:hypothetical protein
MRWRNSASPYRHAGHAVSDLAGDSGGEAMEAMIEATELVSVRVSANGKRLRLLARDQNGQTMAFSLPACWLNAMLTALPHSSGSGTVHLLDSWSMDRMGSSQDLVLTLRTPEGQTVSFAIKPWQVEGMATIATYGNSGRTSETPMH